MHNASTATQHPFLERLVRADGASLVTRTFASEYSVLNEWFNFLTSGDIKSKSKLNMDVDLIVYLGTKPEVAHERVKARSRYVSISNVTETFPMHLLNQLNSDKQVDTD